MIPLVAPPLQMPPTPEMSAKLAFVKWCVLATYICAAARFVTDERIGALNDFFGGLVGTFLLKEDPHLASCYKCLLESPLAAFGDGGLGCLIPYLLMSGLNGMFGIMRVYELLLDEGSLLPCMGKPPDGEHESDVHFVVGLACTRTIWLLVSSVAQLMGMAFSWKVYKLMQLQTFGGLYAHPDDAAERGFAGVEPDSPDSPVDTAASATDAPAGSATSAAAGDAPADSAESAEGQTAAGSSNGRPLSQRQQARNQRRQERQAQAQRRTSNAASATAGGFQPFQGQGHRLTAPASAAQPLLQEQEAASEQETGNTGWLHRPGDACRRERAYSPRGRSLAEPPVEEEMPGEPLVAGDEQEQACHGLREPGSGDTQELARDQQAPVVSELQQCRSSGGARSSGAVSHISASTIEEPVLPQHEPEAHVAVTVPEAAPSESQSQARYVADTALPTVSCKEEHSVGEDTDGAVVEQMPADSVKTIDIATNAVGDAAHLQPASSSSASDLSVSQAAPGKTAVATEETAKPATDETPTASPAVINEASTVTTPPAVEEATLGADEAPAVNPVAAVDDATVTAPADGSATATAAVVQETSAADASSPAACKTSAVEEAKPANLVAPAAAEERVVHAADEQARSEEPQ